GGGVWGTTVGGDVTEDISSLALINSAYGVSFNIGGSNTENVGAVRAELVRGGHSETAASKSETVAAYAVIASVAFGVDATGAIALNTAATKMTLGKGYSAAASGIATVTAATVSLEADTAVTLKCGQAEVVVDASGISCKGAIKVTVEGTGSVKLKPPAIGPG
ncbi:MAG: hypothetical protein K8H88_12830, partial [Sandaracinaceae bacterium]|nr:hypothetical protein [Sandaracinaceae bacterium]